MTAKTSHDQSRKEVQLVFPPEISGEPLIWRMLQDYKLMFNIRKAQITPREEGHLTLELVGDTEQIRTGLEFLRQNGVSVTPFAQRVYRDEALCMHCGLCLTLCPPKALTVDSQTRLLHFDEEKCTRCGQCARICPAKAISHKIHRSSM